LVKERKDMRKSHSTDQKLNNIEGFINPTEKKERRSG
jgi:hypothetical protein